MAEPEDYGMRDRPHISISAFREAAQYSFPTRAQQRKPLREDYAAHAAGLLNQLDLALGDLPAPNADARLSIDGLKPGTVVEVSTLPPRDGSRAKAVKIPANLEFPAQDIVVLRTERRGDRTESALLFVPDEARGSCGVELPAMAVTQATRGGPTSSGSRLSRRSRPRKSGRSL